MEYGVAFTPRGIVIAPLRDGARGDRAVDAAANDGVTRGGSAGEESALNAPSPDASPIAGSPTSASPTGGSPVDATPLDDRAAIDVIDRLSRAGHRLVWADTERALPRLLAATGEHNRIALHVQRSVDLASGRRILSESVDDLPAAPQGLAADASGDDDALFPLGPEPEPQSIDVLAAERSAQLRALAASPRAEGLRLLTAAESVGALVASEMTWTGMPWDVQIHDEELARRLGPRVPYGQRPAAMEALADEIRALTGTPTLNPDSPPDVLRALRRLGLDVESTARWELRDLDHPVIAPLMRYKKLSRLLTANGWRWQQEWVSDGRLRTQFHAGGVVTGRWTTTGGGGLSLPRDIRRAARAEPGWRFVIADAAQLEPRMLAGLARDERLAAAGRERDLYQGLVDTGVVDSRAHGKYGMLGAIYGGTTGESAKVMPRLAASFPRAIGVVESAARTGEAAGRVRTLLGRASPLPGTRYRDAQDRASAPSATAADRARAGRIAREWGRFTRNFVVQGTAAEWANCWLGLLRMKLRAMAGDDAPHLVFFLHDEVVVHAPAHLADDVAAAIRAAGAEAVTMLFGAFPLDVPLDVRIAQDWNEED